MEKRVKYADLVANALILQNVVDMTRGLHILQKAGQNFAPELLAFISPYWTRHIRRLGNYALRLDLPIEDIIFEVPIPPPPANPQPDTPKTPI